MATTLLDNTADGTAALSSSGFFINASFFRGVSFTTSTTANEEIETLTFGLRANGIAGSYTIDISLYETSGGVPTGAAVTSVSVSFSLTLTSAYFTVGEAALGALADYAMSASTTYSLVLSGSTGIVWSFNDPTAAPTAASGYSVGNFVGSVNSGTSWTSQSKDYGAIQMQVTCFLRGTRILTDRGEVAVETLVPGDRVATRFGGLRPIRWIGIQRFDGRLAGPDQQPVRIRAGAMGEGMPHTDLLVSPGHAMLVGLGGGEDVLAHASALVNDITITSEQVDGEIAYFHLDLGPHDCVLANGAWAETYFEDHNRDTFHNAAEFRALYPDHVAHRQDTCLPVIPEGHARTGTAHARLAPKLDDAALTGEADMHLLADGRRVPVEALGGNRYAATIPAGTRSLRLCSRAVRPSMVSDSPDRRALGLMVRGLEIAGTPIAPDHPALARGWHDAEQDAKGPWRWTDGNATIPARLLGDFGATLVAQKLVIEAWHAPRLFAPEAVAALRQAA